jgi:DNA-binding transcriptional LysR family regulator
MGYRFIGPRESSGDSRGPQPDNKALESGVNSWSRLELRYLAALEALAEERSFGRAADRLGYTQSAVSQQIAALERIVGARLAERPRGGPVCLTDAGELLLRHAREIGARIRAAQADLSALRDGDAGALRVGVFQSVGARIVPSVLRHFRNEWPGVEVILHEAVCDRELQDLVAEGELDLAFAVLPAREGPLDVVQLLHDPYVLMVTSDSPLAQRGEPPDPLELAALPLAVFRSHPGLPSEEDHLRARGIPVSVAVRSDNNSTIQGLVSEGVCAGLVPRLAVGPSDGEVVAIELGELLPPRVIGLVSHRARELPDYATTFVEVTRSVARELDLPIWSRERGKALQS